MTRWLSIIGIGEDGVAGLSAPARALISQAVLVVGGTRHLALAAPLIKAGSLVWRSPIEATFADILARRGEPVVVLASGDPFFYGVGSTLMARVGADEILCLPQASSISLAASRLGWALQDTIAVTIHGRPLARVVRHLRDGARLLVLAWDGTSAESIASLLAERGFGGSKLQILEALGGPRETVRSTSAEHYPFGATDPLAIIAIECVASPEARQISLGGGLPDEWFEHDGQMTKRELRVLAISALRPMPGQLLWDIGAGAGSIAIEWLLRHESMRATAFERSLERCARIARNAAALGVPELAIIEGEALAMIEHQPAPDAVFIGGGTSDPALIRRCWGALKPGGALVAHAVTIEGGEALSEAAKTCGGAVIRIDIERLEPVGRFRAFKPAMPVIHLAASKPPC